MIDGGGAEGGGGEAVGRRRERAQPRAQHVDRRGNGEDCGCLLAGPAVVLLPARRGVGDEALEELGLARYRRRLRRRRLAELPFARSVEGAARGDGGDRRLVATGLGGGGGGVERRRRRRRRRERSEGACVDDALCECDALWRRRAVGVEEEEGGDEAAARARKLDLAIEERREESGAVDLGAHHLRRRHHPSELLLGVDGRLRLRRRAVVVGVRVGVQLHLAAVCGDGGLVAPLMVLAQSHQAQQRRPSHDELLLHLVKGTERRIVHHRTAERRVDRRRRQRTAGRQRQREARRGSARDCISHPREQPRVGGIVRRLLGAPRLEARRGRRRPAQVARQSMLLEPCGERRLVFGGHGHAVFPRALAAASRLQHFLFGRDAAAHRNDPVEVRK